jgi:hypothetical protein
MRPITCIFARLILTIELISGYEIYCIQHPSAE